MLVKMDQNRKLSERSVPFKETRINRLAEIAEDYTELVACLTASQGEVRVCHVAREMGISHVSVLKTLKRLARDGYLVKDASGLIQLTEKGKQLAEYSSRKHHVLTEFLLKLGVPKEIAATDVEGIEHYVSPTTLQAIEAHLLSCFRYNS